MERLITSHHAGARASISGVRKSDYVLPSKRLTPAESSAMLKKPSRRFCRRFRLGLASVP